MEIAENELDEERWESWPKYIKNECKDIYAVNCQPQALECEGPTPFITQIMCLMVHQKLRGLEEFGCKCLYIETIHWLPMTNLCIFTYNSWAPTYCQYVIKWSVNRASTICSFRFSANKQLGSHILPKRLYWRLIYAKRLMTRSLANTGNERQRCVNDVWSCVSENQTEDMVAGTHPQCIGRLQGQKC